MINGFSYAFTRRLVDELERLLSTGEYLYDQNIREVFPFKDKSDGRKIIEKKRDQEEATYRITGKTRIILKYLEEQLGITYDDHFIGFSFFLKDAQDFLSIFESTQDQIERNWKKPR